MDIPISNAEFISAIFPEDANVAVCSKKGDPTEGGWSACLFNKNSVLDSNSNNYVNCSSFQVEENGVFNVQIKNFQALYFISFDDVGTKVSFVMFNDFQFSWLIKTSPSNFQAGIILNEPITDFEGANNLVKSICL
jgi:hypothetical protein